MSDKRKLLAEVDRTLKKIQEGMDVFDDIWSKVQEAPTQSHKEKYEQDLKKEIKKLQRLRDQVKTWIASSNDIKDKEPLLKARRDIETKMEKFKDVERETKTKVYSKVGLAQASKMDVNQKKKYEARTALTDFIEKMNIDLEQFESEVEDLEAGARKKKLEKDKQEKLDFLKAITESHNSHITKLEIMLRMLDNDSLDSDTIFGVTDDFKFYLDKADEGQLEDIQYIYEGIDLEETLLESPPQSPEPSVTSKDSDEMRRKKTDDPPLLEPSPNKPLPKLSMPSRSEATTPAKIPELKSPATTDLRTTQPPKFSQSLPNSAPVQASPLIAYAAAAAKALPQVAAVKQPARIPSPSISEEMENKRPDGDKPPADSLPAPTAPVPTTGATMEDTQRRTSSDFQRPAKATTPGLQFPLSASPRLMNTGFGSYASSIVSSTPTTPQSTPQSTPVKDPWKDAGRSAPKSVPAMQNGLNRPSDIPTQAGQVPAAASLQQLASAAVQQQTVRSDEPARHSLFASFPDMANKDEKLATFSVGHSRNASEDLGKELSAMSLASSSPALSLRSSGLVPDGPTLPVAPLITKAELEARITPGMAMVPLGPEKPTRDMLIQHTLLETAFLNPPKPCDSERRKAFIPCVQCPIPPGWPRQPPMPLACDLKFYANLSSDTLFFIFYYQEVRAFLK
ncbi:hypothetical protein RvY_08116-2 [Ramazzottius varieornatus]|uniref:CCR4-Not complex component Not N-terminal domain-containing protein n=1 Tax=Ramazzottius varieornatus TaxID=947166 RepID=A0A1D1V4T1_RAMVA|nr:hypothetical protein RvY_08116-2 [Ramazzottius varieornatus]